MFTFFVVMMLVCMVVTLLTLFTGLFVMTKGASKDNNDKAQLIMRVRVYAQGFAVFFFACAFLSV